MNSDVTSLRTTTSFERSQFSQYGDYISTNMSNYTIENYYQNINYARSVYALCCSNIPTSPLFSRSAVFPREWLYHHKYNSSESADIAQYSKYTFKRMGTSNLDATMNRSMLSPNMFQNIHFAWVIVSNRIMTISL